MDPSFIKMEEIEVISELDSDVNDLLQVRDPNNVVFISDIQPILETSNTSVDDNEPRVKRPRLTKYNPSWPSEYPWLSEGKNEYYCRCLICGNEISIAHSGIYDVKRHAASKTHRRNSERGGSAASQSTTKYQYVKSTSTSKNITAAEFTFFYHSLVHGKNSTTDCAKKIHSLLFPQSVMSQKSTLQPVVRNRITLASAARQLLINQINDNEQKYFSVNTDMLRINNLRIFPIVLQYFNTKIERKLLSLYVTEDPLIEGQEVMKETLKKYKLNSKYLSSYISNNLNLNLNTGNGKQVIAVRNIIRTLIRSILKDATKYLPFDFELIVLKTFNELSNMEHLQAPLEDIHQWTAKEWNNTLIDVSKHWLSLFSPLEKILQHFQFLKLHFLSSNNPPSILKSFFKSNVAEVYTGFLVNMAKIISNKIEPFIKNKGNVIDLYETLYQLKQSLSNRKEEKWFGTNVNTVLTSLQVCDSVSYDKFHQDVILYMNYIIDYLDTSLSYVNEIGLQNLQPFTLCKNLIFDDFRKIVEKFNISVNNDLLFDEFVGLKEFLKASESEMKKLGTEDKWIIFLKRVNFPLMSNIMSYIFSIPVSNTTVENIITHLKEIWPTNKTTIHQIESELLIKSNFNDFNCENFYQFLQTKDGIELINNSKWKTEDEL